MQGLYPQRLLPHNGTGQRLVAEDVAVFPFGLGAEVYVLAQTGELRQYLSGGYRGLSEGEWLRSITSIFPEQQRSAMVFYCCTADLW